jgi:hypothetical protein
VALTPSITITLLQDQIPTCINNFKRATDQASRSLAQKFSFQGVGCYFLDLCIILFIHRTFPTHCNIQILSFSNFLHLILSHNHLCDEFIKLSVVVWAKCVVRAT